MNRGGEQQIRVNRTGQCVRTVVSKSADEHSAAPAPVLVICVFKGLQSANKWPWWIPKFTIALAEYLLLQYVDSINIGTETGLELIYSATVNGTRMHRPLSYE